MPVNLRIQKLPVLPMRGVVLFPEMVLHFDVGRPKSVQALSEAMGENQLIFMTAQRDEREEEPTVHSLYPMGVVARVRQVLRATGEGVRVLVEGLYRAKIAETLAEEPGMAVIVRQCRERRVSDPMREQALLRELREAFGAYAELSDRFPADAVRNIRSLERVGAMTDHVAFTGFFPAEDKQVLLQTLPVEARAMALLALLRREKEILLTQQGIQRRVHEQMDKNQRDYYLREQLKVIADELGEGDNPADEAEDYRARVTAAALPETARERLLKECDKLAKMPSGSHEATVVRGYLDLCLELPWGERTADTLDVAAARRVLDRDHYGMEKVKERVVESLAVRSLAPDIRGQILCFVGPPGVGKTSVAKSIAAAMGRQYARVSLGGVRDEADIRGHRKTYIGAMPGRIIDALRRAGTRNPLILLDEIDKMGNDFRGDPSSAMLEVLDPEQHHAFVDHYLDMPFDLSEVMFITTANNADAIPEPLYDRMDIIRMGSYTAEEKFHIAKEHLLKKQMKRHGLDGRRFRLPDGMLRALIEGYTREAGVRRLEQRIAELCRKAAKKLVAGEAKSVTVNDLEALLGPRRFKPDEQRVKDEVGVVNGLAWTSVGGELMPVEVAVLEGSGKVELTGSLGEVMKESARTAISYVRSRAADFHIERDFYKTKDIHIHVPEGAVPKDGPSAGVTITTAILSALTGIPVRHDVAMTGEISLRGRVLPIGGLKEKTMAAYTHRMATVILPDDNQPDLSEIDPVVREKLRFIPATHLDTVVQEALVREPGDAT